MELLFNFENVFACIWMHINNYLMAPVHNKPQNYRL